MSSQQTHVSTVTTTSTRIRAGITRYRQWLRHSDTQMAELVLMVQQLQTKRLRSTHADLLADPRYNPITEFFSVKSTLA